MSARGGTPPAPRSRARSGSPPRPSPPRRPPPPGAPPALTARSARLWLLAITLVAAILRLYRLDLSPPGLNQDEAISAWISWCLLKTGRDMTGQPWPVFYGHGIGDYPATLYFYTLIPFQLLGGLGVWSTRLAAAVSGIACVPLLYGVGARLFGRPAGLLAAAMLAVNAWHLFLSRFGVGAHQCTLFALIVPALLLRARLPLADGPEAEPSPAWAAAAGLAAGIACYGFQPMRLYFPLLFLLLVAIDPAAWWRLLRSRAGAAALAGLALGFGAMAGPLAWRHLTDPMIAHRWEMTRLWAPGTPLPQIAGLVLARYAAHFHPDFLFARGDLFEIVKPIGQGEFSWYLLPCMAAGLVALAARARASRAARVLIAMLAAYPAGDVISRYLSVHALRSAPGIPALLLLGAFGATSAWTWLRARGRALALAAAAALALAAVALDGRFLARYFGEYNRRPEIYHGYHTDLVEAAGWLKSRLRDSDAVFVTTIGMNEPWAITLVTLGHDPARWFREPRDMRVVGDWEVYVRYGNMRFMYGDLWVPDYRRLEADGVPQHAWFVVRPGELDLKNPVHVVRRPDGRESLWICEITI
ncbi:MAG TPA: phospholipid carrier-dependent glycosyltransferase [Candidatus Eisenbacteria bacterium]